MPTPGEVGGCTWRLAAFVVFGDLSVEDLRAVLYVAEIERRDAHGRFIQKTDASFGGVSVLPEFDDYAVDEFPGDRYFLPLRAAAYGVGTRSVDAQH